MALEARITKDFSSFGPGGLGHCEGPFEPVAKDANRATYLT